jgi:hypothetical protein
MKVEITWTKLYEKFYIMALSTQIRGIAKDGAARMQFPFPAKSKF